MIEAKVIADSVSQDGYRLTTVQATGPRFILAEINTHRTFSRNSASSRAIPVEKQLERIKAATDLGDAASPVEWRYEQAGMQGAGEMEEDDLMAAAEFWYTAQAAAIQTVENYLEQTPKERRVHKSIINRVLEPFMWHTMAISSTEWENFYAQRCSPLAQPEFRVMAEAIRGAIDQSVPYVKSYPGEGHDVWNTYHLPYVTYDEYVEMIRLGIDARQVSIARCARTSYLTQEGIRDFLLDLELYDRLRDPGEGPAHMSPFEHVASPIRMGDFVRSPGNFTGWLQMRHLVFDAPPVRRYDGPVIVLPEVSEELMA